MKVYHTPQDIIKMNLELQTVQRGLQKLGVYVPSVQLFESTRFLNTFKLWESSKQDEFTKLVSGGKKYYNVVKGFLNKV